LVGTVPGAMPPLIGWAAVRGRLDPEAIPAIPEQTGTPLLGGGLRAWCDLSLLRRTFCFSQVEYRRTTSTDRFDHLSPFGLRPDCRA